MITTAITNLFETMQREKSSREGIRAKGTVIVSGIEAETLLLSKLLGETMRNRRLVLSSLLDLHKNAVNSNSPVEHIEKLLEAIDLIIHTDPFENVSEFHSSSGNE